MDHSRPQCAWHPEMKSTDEPEATKIALAHPGSEQLEFTPGIHYASVSMFRPSIQRGTSVQKN